VRLLVDGTSEPATVGGWMILLTESGCAVSVNSVLERGDSGRIRFELDDEIVCLPFVVQWGRRGSCAWIAALTFEPSTHEKQALIGRVIQARRAALFG
jgi:hypothetical protein